MSYELAGGSLKLKGVSDNSIKKKKKKSKSKDLKADLEKIIDQKKIVPEQPGSSSSFVDSTKKIYKTKAELAFEKLSEKRREEIILNRAQRSHKEHVEMYNRQLDNLSEYNDIPKVSWTK